LIFETRMYCPPGDGVTVLRMPGGGRPATSRPVAVLIATSWL
jgi:hypothetical protein